VCKRLSTFFFLLDNVLYYLQCTLVPTYFLLNFLFQNLEHTLTHIHTPLFLLIHRGLSVPLPLAYYITPDLKNKLQVENVWIFNMTQLLNIILEIS
jgi:hypothetical protein